MWIPSFDSPGLSSKSNLSVWPKHIHTHTHCFWEGRRKKGREEKVEVGDRAGNKNRRQLQTFPGDTCFLASLIHRLPYFPKQHLWALVPTENCVSLACEPCQIPTDCFKPGGEVYLGSNHTGADHSFALSSVKNVLEPVRKQTCAVHHLHGHLHLWLYGMTYSFRNYLFPGAIF